MIVGSSLTIEIGDRTLLRDASFVVGAGEKVGLVGRNGTGKSTFISVVINEPGRNVRSTGSAAIRGTYGYLPQVPEPHGLGLEPNGFSHVLSGRGLDVLDDALGKARTQMAKDPSHARTSPSSPTSRSSSARTAATRPRPPWPVWPTGSGSARSCCSRTSRACRAVSGGGST